MAATEKQWFVGEDGCISVGEPTSSVTYHSALNSIIVSTKEPAVKIYDVASGAILQKSSLSAHGKDAVRCIYLPEGNRVVFSDDCCIGVRSDLKGMLLLDTALQSPVNKPEEKIRVEIPLAEATHLLKSLTSAELPGVDNVDEVVKELEKGIESTQEATKGSLKISKWATVCIEIQHGILKNVCSSLVLEMKKLSLYNPGLSAASAVSDRLSYLLSNHMSDSTGATVERSLMYSEAARQDTFRKWPHMNYKWALPDPMSQAGFYHQPNSIGDDRAMCFTCNVCLVCWEPTDEPWSEHERHSPACPFVKGEFTHNVPLSVTYASQPARRHGEKKDKIECISNTTSDDFVATSTLNGNIVVWNARYNLKKHCQFNIDPREITIAVKTGIQVERETGTGSPEGAEGVQEDETDAMPCDNISNGETTEMYEIPVHNGEKSEPTKIPTRPCEDIRVKSLCIIRKPFDEKVLTEKSNTSKSNKKWRPPQPTLLCGASLRCQKLSPLSNSDVINGISDTKEEVQIMNQVNEVVSCDSSPRIIEEDEDSMCEDELTNTTSFVPHLLVLIVKDSKRKSVKCKDKRVIHRISSTNNNVPSLGSLTMNHDFGLLDPMFEIDPDVQIVGVTPGPSVSSPTEETVGVSKSPIDIETLKSDTKVTSSQNDSAMTNTISSVISKTMKAGTILQCVELPKEYQREDLEISAIVPTLDKQHVIVSVIPRKQSKSVISNCVTCNGNTESTMDIPSSGGCLLLYRYKFDDGEYALLEDVPVMVKSIDKLDNAITSVLILPSDVCDLQEEEDEGNSSEISSQVPNSRTGSSKSCDVHGLIVVTLSSGKFWLMNVCDFKVLAEVLPPENDQFISSTYCSGIERLCLSSENGKLHFYQLCEQSRVQIELTADSPDGMCNGDIFHDPDVKSENEFKDKVEKKTLGSDILAKQPLSVENLMILHNLIQFENLMPRFTATVPPCWSEIQQEQQQRRHPQHLQHQGEATQHTRTWKLQPDSNTWDEHIFEIVLTRPCCVGHVDVKFSLHPMCTSCPDIQITLLKQNITSIGRQTGSPNPSGTDVDKVVDFKITSPNSSTSFPSTVKGGSSENNVLDPLFLESHNAELLCGPVNISTCVDLSGNSGLITLTSPQLLNSKPKAFLVHLKGFPSKVEESSNSEQPKEAKKKSGSQLSAHKLKIMKKAFDNDLFVPPSSVKDQQSSSLPRTKYPDNLKGCDWISEISVTIRKTKKTQLSKERLQRILMLKTFKFHEKLLDGVSFTEKFVFCGVSADHWQNMILDILLWITAVQMNDPERSNIKKSLSMIMQKRLTEIVRTCFIQGSRTTAHKCSKLVALCMEHCKLSPDQDLAPAFSFSLLQALMENLQLIPSAQSSGAIRWFFTLLNRVKCMDVVSVAESCTDLLMEMSKHCYERTSSLHSLLKSRYGMYGQPFDGDLFDSELPVSLKQTPPVSTYASALGNNINSGSNCNSNSANFYIEEIDFYDLFNPPSDKSMKVQLEYAKNNVFGMLEVEPLHFTCHATSDGTKMEKLDQQGISSVANNTSGLGGTINFGEWNPPSAAAAATAANLSSLSSKMAVTKQHLQELSNKTYPTFKHKIMHIKQILNEVGKSLPAADKYNSDQLLPPTPKSTPQVITPPLTPPNEYFQNQAAVNKTDKLFPLKSSVGMQNAQTLLQQPPLQALVIERMHSGARRFVILDFGKPIVLTDVVIPACSDLASLSIDVWVQGEEIDGQRFVVASDIGVRSLIMNDIIPTLVCRYLKITTIGRYGSGSARSKIPIGSFYGHGYILPWEWNSYLEQRTTASMSTGNQMELTTQSQLLAQLDVYVSLLEDIQCRYSLARTRLENLLICVDGQHYASSHIQYFLKKSRKNNEEDNKILQAYNDCLQLQLQQNLAQRVIDRLQAALGVKLPKLDSSASLSVRLRQACSDKLRFLQERLLDTLLSMTTCSPSIPLPPQSLYNILCPQTAQTLFKHLCVHGKKKTQISAGVLLMRVCGTQSWWGNFFGNVLQEFFHSENIQIFPQDRVFVLLVAMGQKSLAGPCAVNILESLLDMLAKVLSPILTGQQSSNQTGIIDLTLVSWILLFLCRNLEHTSLNNEEKGACAKSSGANLPNRWNFIQGDHANSSSKSKSKSAKVYRWTMQKRLQHHKKKLMDLEQAQKTFFSSQFDSQGSNTHLKAEKQFRKELSQYATKMRRNDEEMFKKLSKSDNSCKGGDDDDNDGVLVLSKEKTLRVVRGLMALLLNMDFTCNVDLFLVTCKVLATVCVMTRPAVTLSEAMTQDQLERLILLASNLDLHYGNVSWGGPWAGHAITCLLQDILDGEKFYPVPATQPDLGEELASTVTDESLHHSVSLPTMSNIDDTEQDQDPSSGENNDTESDYKEEPSKMNFEKESSLMVDLLLDESEYDDDTSAKLHEYVTGETMKPSVITGALYESIPISTTSLNGTIEVSPAINISAEAEKKKNILKKMYAEKEDAEIMALAGITHHPGPSFKQVTASQGMSTAVDARLELGLETQSELKLKVMVSLHTENVQQSFSYALPTNVPTSVHPDINISTDDEIVETNGYITTPQVTSPEMLSQCYEHLFRQLVPNRINLDALLQLWVTLNCDSGVDGGQMAFDPTRTPSIPLSEVAVKNLLDVVASTPSIQLSTWVLVFQTLSLLANQKVATPVGDQSMVVAMIADSHLITSIKMFLSGTSEHGPLASAVQYTQVGPSATKFFFEFLMRLLIRCTPDSLEHLYELMLKLVYTLTAERGAFHCGLGPLDAQCKFMDVILEISFEHVDISNAISVIESISTLVHQHLMSQERVTCRSSSENSINARSCFGGLFASLLRGGDSKTAMGDASRDLLMCSLLKLVNSLIQIKCGTRNNQVTTLVHDSVPEPHTPTNLSFSEPVSDSTKLSQALATSTPMVASSMPMLTMSDDDKSQQTDEQKTETRNNAPVEPVFIYLTDIILGHRHIMNNLIQALSYCNSNTMAAILGSREISSHMQETFTGGDPISVGDGIYQILVTLSRHCTDQKLVLESLLHYMSGSYTGLSTRTLCRLSEPLLWFALKVLDSAKAIHLFLDMNGIEVICENLVNCNSRIINTSPSLISTIMQNLNGKTRSNDKRSSSDPDSADGLQNFAPLGSISSSSPTASPSEVLIQAAPPHRRARSAAWSYHFYPDEAWVDLTMQLPFAILLSEVQIQPHSASLTTCPAYVSLEISHDSVTHTPQCQPLMTSSLAFIKLQLQRPQIATTVTIRLHKARDSMTIGLSQVMLMGYSAFGYTGSSTQNILLPTVDFISQSSVRWIRLLHHCLTSHKDIEDLVAAAAATTHSLLSTCSALLVSPVSSSSVYFYNIEAVLLKLGLHSLQMGLAFIDNVLRSPSCQQQRDMRTPFMGKVSGLANDSTVEILYQLGITQDPGTSKRVQALLNWLGDSARVALQRMATYSNERYNRIAHLTTFMSLPSPAPSHIHCVAVILWQSHQLPVEYNLSALITKDLVSCLYEWSITLTPESTLKKAIDDVLCSVCHISPEFFTQILTWVGISFTAERNGFSESVSDDIKDNSHLHQESMTDDSKEANSQNRQTNIQENHFMDFPTIFLKEFRHISLEETHLATLANSCKSPVAIRQLLDSGFPAVLAQGLFEFCNKMISRFSDSSVSMEGLTDTSKTINDESASGSANQSSAANSLDKSLWITADLVSAVLHFFAELSTEPVMKDWLGEAEGNIFWPSLLTLLCNAPVQTSTVSQQTGNKSEPMSVEDRTSIETAAVQFFNRVISCHLVNQLLFAKVMCEVIKEQSIGTKNGPTGGNFPLSGFARCLFLQVLLEDEKILVSLKLENQQQKIQTCKNAMPMEHPNLCGGRSCQCMLVSLHTTCSELLHKISESYSLPGHFVDKPSDKPSDDAKKDMGNITSDFTDISSTVVSGMIAKEKREKDDKSFSKVLPPRPPTRRRRYTADAVSSQLQPPNFTLYHPLLPNKPLPNDLTLSQLLQVLHQRGLQHGNGLLEFIVKLESKKSSEQSCNQPDDWTESDEEENEMSYALLLSTPSFPSALQIFASVGGLALLAEHLPLLYDPELTRQPTSQENSTQSSKSVSNTMGVDDWVTVEPFPEEFYELYEPISPAPTVQRAANSSLAFPTIPPHSLIAFGLFLRLPGYAEVLLKERKKAQCLLRLVLGVTDDGDGGHILTSPIASSLPTLPFLVLKSLYDSMPLTTDDGVLLRRMSLEIWAIHLILACLSVLSHHLPRVSMPGFQQEAHMILSAMQTATTTTTTTAPAQTEEKSQQYWAKGTGFGTGSTTSSWDAEQALVRQKQEEEHVACLLQVLASYVNPSGEVPTEFDISSYTCPSEKMLLPDMIPELLSQSCLIPAISSYLRNDSVLDMARHIPMYRALLELLRGIAVCPSLVPLLLPLDKDNNQDSAASIGVLLEKMRKCVDTYASRLKSNKGKNGQNGNTASTTIGTYVGSTEEEEENEGLALLIPNIQETARIVKIATDRLQLESGTNHTRSEDMEASSNSAASKHNTDEKYMAVMKPLQFDVFQIVEDDNNGIKFNCRHHYENNIRTAGDNSNPARTRRLAQEAVTLSTSLPLSAGSSVFVRCDEERLDVMKVLITGPSDTPYANGCFEFDVYFPQDYPNSPPFINLTTTGNHTVRFNPNLYNDGKVCLSVLNTWHGRPEEKWNSQTSSFLQVLVSIQSLILVSEPYFNEPGYERSRGTPSGTANSREYDANIRQATVKWAMLEQLKNPCPSLKEIIQKHFWIKRREILKQCEDWITEMEGYSTDKRTGRTIAHSTMALKRHYNQLREELSKMKPPESLEEEENIDIQEKIYSTESSMTTSMCDSEMPGSSIPTNASIMDSNSNTIVEDVVEIL